jgi:hypothetical protein
MSSNEYHVDDIILFYYKYTVKIPGKEEAAFRFVIKSFKNYSIFVRHSVMNPHSDQKIDIFWFDTSKLIARKIT